MVETSETSNSIPKAFGIHGNIHGKGRKSGNNAGEPAPVYRGVEYKKEAVLVLKTAPYYY